MKFSLNEINYIKNNNKNYFFNYNSCYLDIILLSNFIIKFLIKIFIIKKNNKKILFITNKKYFFEYIKYIYIITQYPYFLGTWKPGLITNWNSYKKNKFLYKWLIIILELIYKKNIKLNLKLYYKLYKTMKNLELLYNSFNNIILLPEYIFLLDIENKTILNEVIKNKYLLISFTVNNNIVNNSYVNIPIIISETILKLILNIIILVWFIKI